MDVPPENRLSRPTMDGEIVENVVPLSAREETDGTRLEYGPRNDDRELMVSVLLVVDTGLAMADLSIRACSIDDISLVFRWIVERVTGPRPVSDCREGALTGIGGAVPGMWCP